MDNCKRKLLKWILNPTKKYRILHENIKFDNHFVINIKFSNYKNNDVASHMVFDVAYIFTMSTYKLIILKFYERPPNKIKIKINKKIIKVLKLCCSQVQN